MSSGLVMHSFIRPHLKKMWFLDLRHESHVSLAGAMRAVLQSGGLVRAYVRVRIQGGFFPGLVYVSYVIR